MRKWLQEFFSLLFFLISSVEEGECSRKNILKKQNKLAKKNKHGILVLRLNFVWWKSVPLGLGNSACTALARQLCVPVAQRWVKRHHWTCTSEKLREQLVEVRGKSNWWNWTESGRGYVKPSKWLLYVSHSKILLSYLVHTDSCSSF